MDSKTIESWGVMAVQKSVMLADMLSPFISDNDKQPSWDGFIYIYYSKTKTTENIRGRVPVQVKGKLMKDLYAKEITYPVKVADLRNYFRDGGAIYFVVYINKDHPDQQKIYYQTLTPVKLNHYLKNIGSKRTKSIKLREFPDDNNKKVAILSDFWYHSKKQTGHFDQFISIEDITEKQIPSYLTIPLGNYASTDELPSLSELLKSEMYLYMVPEGSNVLIPTDMLIASIDATETIDDPVSVCGQTFYNSYKRTSSPGRFTIKIGESIKMNFEENSTTITTNATFTSNLRERVKDMDFFVKSIKAGQFSLGETDIPLATLNPVINITPFENRLALDCKLVQMLDILGIKEDLDTDKLTQSENRDINALVKVFVENQDLSDLCVITPSLINLKLGNIHIKLIILKKVNDKYTIQNFFDSDIMVSYKDEEGKKRPAPSYSTLSKEEWMTVSNINYEDILPSYKKLVGINDNIYDRATADMLNILLAYDEKPNSRLLQTAKEITLWIKSDDNRPYANIRTLNYLQVIKRERALSDVEKKQLCKIAESSSSSRLEKVGANLLLDNQVSADFHFQKLDQSEQEAFMTFPINVFSKTRI